ncbi:MAG: hypothetical protein WBL50_00225 [Candidatus Acidiferrum sp.]
MVGAVLLADTVSARAAQDPEEGTPLTLKVGRQIQATDFNTQSADDARDAGEYGEW